MACSIEHHQQKTCQQQIQCTGTTINYKYLVYLEKKFDSRRYVTEKYVETMCMQHWSTFYVVGIATCTCLLLKARGGKK